MSDGRKVVAVSANSGADPRWNNPNHVPLSNGPVRTTTTQAIPTFVLEKDGQEIEFLLPFPMHIVDASPWPCIRYTVKGVPITIDKPLSVAGSYAVPDSRSTEQSDCFCTVVRIRTPFGVTFSAADGWQAVQKLAEWIRIKCRHYWVLHGSVGYGALFRSATSIRHGENVSLSNAAAYGGTVIVLPLSEAIWQTLGEELESDAAVPLPESLYCDALLSLVSGNSMKAAVEGV
jgi:hypothetical protein